MDGWVDGWTSRYALLYRILPAVCYISCVVQASSLLAGVRRGAHPVLAQAWDGGVV